jgi:myo-inositol-1(or 4)-monophosphatase
MDSSPNWQKILHDMAEHVRSRVLDTLPKRKSLDHFKFKMALDLEAQDAIIEKIKENDLSVKLISEEGNRDFAEGQYFMVADPVDGTTNLARGLHPSVTSISVSTDHFQRNVIAGIVKEIFTGETYYSEKNRGSSLDGVTINVAHPVEYKHGLISMDISKVPRLERLTPLIKGALHIRSEGCSAISLCQIASGVLDAHIDLRGIVRATDISAGLLILKEAGGLYTIDSEINGELSLRKETHVELIAASSKEMLEQINQIMNKR